MDTCAGNIFHGKMSVVIYPFELFDALACTVVFYLVSCNNYEDRTNM